MLFEVLQGMPLHIHHIVSPVVETQGSWIIICHMLLYLRSLHRLFCFCRNMTFGRWEMIKMFPVVDYFQSFGGIFLIMLICCFVITSFCDVLFSCVVQHLLLCWCMYWMCSQCGRSVICCISLVNYSWPSHLNSTPDSQPTILAQLWHDACLYHSSDHHQGWASLWVPNPVFVT